MILYQGKRFGKIENLRNYKLQLIINLLHIDNFIFYIMFTDLETNQYCKISIKCKNRYLYKIITNKELDGLKTSDELIEYVNEIERKFNNWKN